MVLNHQFIKIIIIAPIITILINCCCGQKGNPYETLCKNNKDCTAPRKCCPTLAVPNEKLCYHKCPQPISTSQVQTSNCTIESFGNRKFKICFEPKLDWFEAFLWCCEKEDGVLTDIHNAAEIKFLSEKFPEINDVGPWIGLNDITVKEDFRWLTKGSRFNVAASSGNWAAGQPNGNSKYNQSCVMLSTLRNDPGLVDLICQKEFPFVCLIK